MRSKSWRIVAIVSKQVNCIFNYFSFNSFQLSWYSLCFGNKSCLVGHHVVRLELRKIATQMPN